MRVIRYDVGALTGALLTLLGANYLGDKLTDAFNLDKNTGKIPAIIGSTIVGAFGGVITSFFINTFFSACVFAVKHFTLPILGATLAILEDGKPHLRRTSEESAVRIAAGFLGGVILNVAARACFRAIFGSNPPKTDLSK
ncbi:MAG: hypothetical protein J0H68_03935 [Sphingobacteriia bacterium]|nr:hypothetical protein [Sphingobacteriia bacterium]